MSKKPAYNKGKGKAYAWILAHVDYDGDDCLPWPFSVDTKGYGRFGLNGENRSAPRVLCELVRGPPPTSKHQCAHSCGHGHLACMNRKHLSWKTNGENQRDKRKHRTTDNGRTGQTGKLTEQDITEIQAAKGHIPIMTLAEMYGVKRGTIDRWHRIARDGYDKNAIR